MAGGITIEIDDAEIRAALDALAARGGDLSAVMSDIGAAVLTSTQQRFEAEAGPGGVKWAPFAKSTLRGMPARRRARPWLLRDKVSPGLYSSLHAETDERSAEIGTNLVYAAIHQLGGTIAEPAREQTSTFIYAKEGAATTRNGKRVGSRLRFAKASTRAKSRHERTYSVGAHSVRIPARPYLGVDDADQAEILAIITSHYQAVPGMEPAP